MWPKLDLKMAKRAVFPKKKCIGLFHNCSELLFMLFPSTSVSAGDPCVLLPDCGNAAVPHPCATCAVLNPGPQVSR